MPRKDESVTVRMPSDLKAYLQQRADNEDETISFVLCDIVKRAAKSKPLQPVKGK